MTWLTAYLLGAAFAFYVLRCWRVEGTSHTGWAALRSLGFNPAWFVALWPFHALFIVTRTLGRKARRKVKI